MISSSWYTIVGSSELNKEARDKLIDSYTKPDAFRSLVKALEKAQEDVLKEYPKYGCICKAKVSFSAQGHKPGCAHWVFHSQWLLDNIYDGPVPSPYGY